MRENKWKLLLCNTDMNMYNNIDHISSTKPYGGSKFIFILRKHFIDRKIKFVLTEKFCFNSNENLAMSEKFILLLNNINDLNSCLIV